MRRHHHHHINLARGLGVRQHAATGELDLREAIARGEVAAIHQKHRHRFKIKRRGGQNTWLGGVLIGAPNALAYANPCLVLQRD